MNNFETRLEIIVERRKSDLYQKTEELGKFKEFFSDLEDALVKCFGAYHLDQVRLAIGVITDGKQHFIRLYDSKDHSLFGATKELFRFNFIEEYDIPVNNLIQPCPFQPDIQVDTLLSCIKQHYAENSYLSVEIENIPRRRVDEFVSNLVFKLRDIEGL